MNRIKNRYPDCLALTLLILIPLAIYWAVWTPNPADRWMFIGDILWEGYVQRVATHDLLIAGELPLWNEYIFGGLPLLGDVQAAPFYPPNLILDLLYWGRDIPFIALEMTVIAHTIAAGIFLYLYLRNLPSRPVGVTAALIGAIAFQFNGFFVGHRGHYIIIAVMTWLPLIMLLLDKAWHTRDMTRRIGWAIAAGFALALSIMGGHPQSVYYVALIVGGYFLFRWLTDMLAGSETRRPFWHKPFALGISGVVAGGLSAVTLLPVAELIGRSLRSEADYAFAAEYSLLPRNFINLILPNFLEWSSTEFRIYAGILTVVLAAVALTIPQNPRPERRFFVILSVIALFIALSAFTALHGILYQFLPGFDSIRVNVRAFFAINYALAILSAFGADTLLNPLRDTETTRLHTFIKRSRWFIVAAVSVAVLLYILLITNFTPVGEAFYTRDILDPTTAADPFTRLNQITNQYILFIVFLLCALGIVWARLSDRLTGLLLSMALVALMVIDVGTAARYHDMRPFDPDTAQFTVVDYQIDFLEEPWEQNGQTALIQHLQTLPPHQRIDNAQEVLPANYGAIHKLPFSTGRYILELAERQQMQMEWPNVNPAVWHDLLNVHTIVTQPDEPQPADTTLAFATDMGNVWQRNDPPSYINFSAQIRPIDDLTAVRATLNASSDPFAHPAVSSANLMEHCERETGNREWCTADMTIGTTNTASPVNISILAGGQGNLSGIIVAGERVTPQQRGMLVALIDPNTGDVTHGGVFDTYQSEMAADQLAATIESAPPNTIIALATYDEGTRLLTDRAHNAFASIGIATDLRDAFGQSYGAIGVKGAAVGTALEQVDSSLVLLDVGVAAVTNTSTTPDHQLITQTSTRQTIIVENDTATLMTISEPVYPGWQAYLNGEPVPTVRVNGILRGVILPPVEGDLPNEVNFVYEPMSVRLGAAVSLTTLFLATGALLSTYLLKPK